ncbi:MAG: hypothetical protein R3B67_05830 [Phycisphaerales bacterium]
MSDTTSYEPVACSKAPLNPRWRFKLGVIALIVFLVGCWGLWDATSVYPNRGKKFAEWAQWQYLQQAKKADSEDFGIFLSESSISDPIEEFNYLSEPDRLTQNRADAGNPSSSRTLRASRQMALQQWLAALKVVGMLDAEHTTIQSPQTKLDELQAKWSKIPTQPKPLSAFDLMTQWLIMGICYLVTLWMLVHMMRVASKRYAWDPDTMTLTLPGGASITPDDLEEVDKRKWDKFIVFLRIKGSHPQLGGQEVRIDTYQHSLVEDWILAMEEKAFPSQEGVDGQTDSDNSTADETTDDAEPTA